MRLARTKAAVEVYDQALRSFQDRVVLGDIDEVLGLLAAVEQAHVAVGEAFAADTADCNSPDVARLIHPQDPWLLRLIEKYG